MYFPAPKQMSKAWSPSEVGAAELLWAESVFDRRSTFQTSNHHWDLLKRLMRHKEPPSWPTSPVTLLFIQQTPVSETLEPNAFVRFAFLLLKRRIYKRGQNALCKSSDTKTDAGEDNENKGAETSQRNRSRDGARLRGRRGHETAVCRQQTMKRCVGGLM